MTAVGSGLIAVLDIPAVLALAEARGYDRRAVALLLPAFAAGVSAGFAGCGESDPEPSPDTSPDI
ncbi:MAG: hypothetical protein WCF85_16350 [Rhodospirillaceae bacterium]